MSSHWRTSRSSLHGRLRPGPTQVRRPRTRAQHGRYRTRSMCAAPARPARSPAQSGCRPTWFSLTNRRQPADTGGLLRGAVSTPPRPFTLRLEGDVGRFPTEPGPFSELGLANAPWTRAHDLRGPGRRIHGRGALARQHRASGRATGPRPRLIGRRFVRMSRLDVMRLLVARADDEVCLDRPDRRAGRGVRRPGVGFDVQLLPGRRLTTSASALPGGPAQFELTSAGATETPCRVGSCGRSSIPGFPSPFAEQHRGGDRMPRTARTGCGAVEALAAAVHPPRAAPVATGGRVAERRHIERGQVGRARSGQGPGESEE